MTHLMKSTPPRGGELVIVGLGPGDPDAISTGSLRALREAEFVILRTEVHPTTSLLVEEGISYVCCDDIYEQALDFEDAYRDVVERVMQAALSGLKVAYAVPGHPRVFEDTTSALIARCKEAGVPCRTSGSESFIEPVLSLLGLDPGAGLLIRNALGLSREHLVPSVPLLVAQVYDRDVASDVKITLSDVYGDEHPVAIVVAAGVRGQESVLRVRVLEMDRLAAYNHLTSVFVPPRQTKATRPSRRGSDDQEDGHTCDFPLDPLVDVIACLRGEGGCPWDREQDHMSLRPFVLEEAYEVVEAIELGEMHKLCEELGDLLLQIALHSQIAAESGAFNLNDVVSQITTKMIRRHPHVFAGTEVSGSDEVLERWQIIKKAEKGQTSTSIIGDVPKHLPALMRAFEVQKRAAKVGFDWPVTDEVFDKITEESQEVKVALKKQDQAILEAEIGDLLFSVVNLARHVKVSPEVALGSAVARFAGRFRRIEAMAGEQGKRLEDMSLAEMDDLWNEAKKAGL